MKARKTPTPPPAAAPSCWVPLIAGAAIVGAGIAAYADSFSGPFIFDDQASIPENPTIRSLAGALVPPHAGGLTVNGRPVLNLSLAVNYAVSGDEVWSYHAANLAIHLLAALILFGLVHRTLRLVSGLREQAGLLAGAIACLWVVHPLQTEAVTYVIQRAESLMGLFYLLTLYCFVRGSMPSGTLDQRTLDQGTLDRGASDRDALGRGPRNKGKPGPGASKSRGGGAVWLGLSCLACLLGMGTKETMVSAPVMVLLYDRTFVSGTFRRAWESRRRYYALLAAPWLPLALLVAAGGGNRGGSVGFGLGPPWPYWLTQFGAVSRYLALSVWPHPLVFEYGAQWVKHWAEVLPSAALVLVLVGATGVALRRRPALGFLGAWFGMILAPTSLMPGTTEMTVEYRMYLPLAAVLVLLVLGLHRWLGKWSLAPILALVLAGGILTSWRNDDYRSDVAIWSDTVAKRPENARARYDLGYALSQAGEPEQAMAEYREALRLQPDDAEVHNSLGNALAGTGQTPEAIAEYREALRLHPNYAAARNNLGNALAQSGRLDEAVEQFQALVRLDPDYAKGHENLGHALADLGRRDEAVAQYEKALSLDPADARAREALAELGAAAP